MMFRDIFLGDLVAWPPLRARAAPRPTVDDAIRAVWRAYCDGRIDERQAQTLDTELRRRQATIVTALPLRRPIGGARAIRPY